MSKKTRREFLGDSGKVGLLGGLALLLNQAKEEKQPEPEVQDDGPMTMSLSGFGSRCHTASGYPAYRGTVFRPGQWVLIGDEYAAVESVQEKGVTVRRMAKEERKRE